MAAINFPSSPQVDDTFVAGEVTYIWDGVKWKANTYVPESVSEVLDTKQDTLVSGTNIKTVNGNSLVGSGDVAVQPTLVSGTNIKTINSTSLLGSGNITITTPEANTTSAGTVYGISAQYNTQASTTSGNTGVGRDVILGTSNTYGNVFLGANVSIGTTSYRNIAIGRSAAIPSNSALNTVIGDGASVSSGTNNSVVVGASSGIGTSANGTAINGVINSSAYSSITIGGTIYNDSHNSINIGGIINSYNSYVVNIGGTVGRSNSVNIGRLGNITGQSVALGYSINDQGYNAIVLNGNNSGSGFSVPSSGFFVTGVTSGTANNVLYFDDTTKKITYGAPAGGSLALGDLTNVTISNPTNGQVLKYNGTAWVNGTDETGGGGEEPPPADVYRSTKIAPTQVYRNGSYSTIITFATAADANLVRNFLIKVSTLSTQSSKIVTFALTNSYSNRITFDSNFQSWSYVQGSSLVIDNYFVNEPSYTNSGVDVAWYSPDFVGLNNPTELQVSAGGITDLSTLAPGWFPHAVEFYLDYVGPNATRIRPSASPTLTPAITAFTAPTTNVGLFTVDTTNNTPSQVSPFTGISYVMFTLGKYELVDPNAPEPWYTVQNGTQGELSGSIDNPAGFNSQLFGQFDKQVLIGNSPYNGSQYFSPINSFNNGPTIGETYNNNQTRTYFTRNPSPAPSIGYYSWNPGTGLVAAWAQPLPTNSATVAGYLSGDDSYSNYDGRGFFGNNYSGYLVPTNTNNPPPSGGTVKFKAVMVFTNPVEVALFSTYAAATGTLLETFSYQDPSYGTYTRFVFFTCTNDTIARQMCVDQAPILQFSQTPGGPPFQVTHLVWAWWERTL